MNYIKYTAVFLKRLAARLRSYLPSGVCFGRSIADLPKGSIVFFPYSRATFYCGLAGIVSFKRKDQVRMTIDMDAMQAMAATIKRKGLETFNSGSDDFDTYYLGGETLVADFAAIVRTLKEDAQFSEIYFDESLQSMLNSIAGQLTSVIEAESRQMEAVSGRLAADRFDIMSRQIETIKDIAWCLKSELLNNITKVRDLAAETTDGLSMEAVVILKKINAVFNSIDRLEVRGRDSAGFSLLFVMAPDEYDVFQTALAKKKLVDTLARRSAESVLVNNSIRIHKRTGRTVSMAFVYKVAAEIGSLGDNITHLRRQVRNDPILQTLLRFTHQYHTVSSHTRWASVGAITEPNCHPVDNITTGGQTFPDGIIHTCLNGDIDNFLDLKLEYERNGGAIDTEITTDTKIIPLRIEKHIKAGNSVEEAFRLAVNDFKGSHAISMHTDLAPGKFFLAQRGSGQAVFVGLAADHYMPASEVYGFIEETSSYLKMDGEKVINGNNGPTQGQIFILDQNSGGGSSAVKAMFYDGTMITLADEDIKHTDITSRDIDRRNFPHYFLKEISESPRCVEQTLQNRWKTSKSNPDSHLISLDKTVIPPALADALTQNLIKRVFFIGQGTAGVAAQVCADILSHYLADPSLQVAAFKASELSGFKLGSDSESGMTDALVIAISQSGTTTDTNRTVDMVRERGGHTLAIVNRRDSDVTFKVDGVLYTSSGRDIEMSVASTKAFYSQIIAGALLSLYIADIKNCRSGDFISEEIKKLLTIPSQMQKVLDLKDKIKASADRHAAEKTYWAAVGSGPNKASADEIRIKLSELCYKTISSDFVEDKKHIDLSSEPLIIVCAAGAGDTVVGDIVKDTAIFQAHKATPIVIADEGETRFTPYATDLFFVPRISQHLAPILNTLAGHIWGYYAALAINDSSRFLHRFREEIQKSLDDYAAQGLNVYEVVLEKSFREKFVRFYKEFKSKISQKLFPIAIAPTSDLVLLLKYLAGRLPVADFELDFNKKGTALNMINMLFECLGKAINRTARPIDAIKHQAKTVTVGTSRISAAIDGILFDALNAHDLAVSQILNRNVIVLKNLQAVVESIQGSILYKIGKLNSLGELADDTTIEVKKKEGVLKPIPSRVESDTRLKGTKRIIVKHGNVYIGKGRKDDRSMIVIPVMSPRPETANMIEYLLLLNISFKENISSPARIKALGGKYDHIINLVQENSVTWEDSLLEPIATDELFGKSAEKIAEMIVSDQSPEQHSL